jgi:hypothetical protein
MLVLSTPAAVPLATAYLSATQGPRVQKAVGVVSVTAA